MHVTDSRKLKELFAIEDSYASISKLNWTDSIKGKVSAKTNILKDTEYTFQGMKSASDDLQKNFVELMKMFDEPRKYFKNEKDNYNEKNNWTRVEWETPAYSMKTKKFTCDSISYNAQTGRVNKIEFREL